jgi:hypothetical protein
MTEAQLKKLVNEAVSLHRALTTYSERLKTLKADLISEAQRHKVFKLQISRSEPTDYAGVSPIRKPLSVSSSRIRHDPSRRNTPTCRTSAGCDELQIAYIPDRSGAANGSATFGLADNGRSHSLGRSDHRNSAALD